MSNWRRDEDAFIRTIRRCLQKNWYSVTVTDEAKGYKYDIKIIPIKIGGKDEKRV